MSYLVVKYNTITQIMDAEAVEPSKPYVKVKDGYFPLTTETNRTGLYTRVLGSSYRLVQRSYTTTSEITSSSTHVDSYVSTASGYVTESETESTITGSGYVRYSKPKTGYTATITVRATLPPYGLATIVYNTSMPTAYSSASIRTSSMSRVNTNNVHSVFIYSPTMKDENSYLGAMTFKETISVPETSYIYESRISSETFDTYTIETLRSIIASNTEMYFTYTDRTTSKNTNGFTRALQYGQTMTNALTYTQYTLRSDMYSEFTITDIYSSTVTLTIR